MGGAAPDEGDDAIEACDSNVLLVPLTIEARAAAARFPPACPPPCGCTSPRSDCASARAAVAARAGCAPPPRAAPDAPLDAAAGAAARGAPADPAAPVDGREGGRDAAENGGDGESDDLLDDDPTSQSALVITRRFIFPGSACMCAGTCARRCAGISLHARTSARTMRRGRVRFYLRR
jgi:hypothetical protein